MTLAKAAVGFSGTKRDCCCCCCCCCMIVWELVVWISGFCSSGFDDDAKLEVLRFLRQHMHHWLVVLTPCTDLSLLSFVLVLVFADSSFSSALPSLVGSNFGEEKEEKEESASDLPSC